MIRKSGTEGGLAGDHGAATSISGSEIGSACVWGLVGFTLGAVFWHFIGFWTFMTHVVLDTPMIGVRRLERPISIVTELRLSPARTGSSSSRMALCAELALNRQTGETTSGPCSPARKSILVGNSVAMRHDRDDRPLTETVSTSVAGWSATVSGRAMSIAKP